MCAIVRPHFNLLQTMAKKKDWSELEGRPWRLDVNSTKEEAMAAEDPSILHLTTDGHIIMNGVEFCVVPTLQSGVKGTGNNYIYSNSGDNTHAALSGTFKVFQNSGKCYVRHKFWGSTNDYNDGQYTTCEFPTVNTSSNGCMEAAMLVRLRNTTIYEGASTTESMVVLYPNYADGSTKTLTLTKATTAKAGVMTAADKTKLNGLNANMVSGQDLRANNAAPYTDENKFMGLGAITLVSKGVDADYDAIAPSVAGFHTTLVISPWNDKTGGYQFKLGFGGGKIAFNYGVSAWEGWRVLATTDQLAGKADKTTASAKAAGLMSAEDKVKVDTLNGGIAQQKDGSYKTLTGKAVIETHSDVVGEEVSLTDFNNAQATTYNKGDVINLYYTKGAYGVLAQKDMLWFGRRVVSNDSSNGTLVKYDFKTIAGVEPKDAFNSDITLYFLTLKGYTSAFSGSAGYTLYPLNVSAVPYLPSTADKVLLEKIKQKLGL